MYTEKIIFGAYDKNGIELSTNTDKADSRFNNMGKADLVATLNAMFPGANYDVYEVIEVSGSNIPINY
jgi:hypothetical protein